MFGMNNFSRWFKKETFNRNAYILKNLLEDKRIGKVLYIDLLPNTIERGIKSYIKNQILRSREKIIYRDFFSVCHQAQTSEFFNTSKGLFYYSTIDSIFGEKIMIKKINKLLKKLEFKNIILWSCNPMFCGYFGKLGETISCFDTIDNWTELSWYKNQKEKLTQNYQLIKKKANIIFTVSPELINLFFQNKKNVYFISQGIDLNRFQKKLVCPEDIKQIPHPIIGCVGVITDRLDFNLISNVINQNKNLSFVFIGSIWLDKNLKLEIENLSRFDNVYFLGIKNFNEVPAYINQFDVCFAFYKVNLSTKCGDSMKIYEYLALGKPIISTNTGGVEKFSDLIKIIKTPEEFNNSLKECLKEKDENLKNRRIKEVKKYDWKKIVEEMLNKIEQLIISYKTKNYGTKK
jgi:glycosyltransferase involved in cell wall biosynthesis